MKILILLVALLLPTMANAYQPYPTYNYPPRYYGYQGRYDYPREPFYRPVPRYYGPSIYYQPRPYYYHPPRYYRRW